jgi:hypothetical protein
MRLAVLGPVVLQIVSGVACTCTMPVYEARRNVSADITWSNAARVDAWGAETWVGDGTGDTDTTDFVWFYDGSDDPASLPNDLRIWPYLGAVSTGIGDPNAGSRTQIAFRMYVHDVTPGAAEIDLDDTRASLTAGFIGDTTESFLGGGVVHHALGGHLSLTKFAPGSCPAGPFSCNITVRGTLAFTATGANGELLSVTGGALSGTESIFKGTQMCPQAD